MFRVVQSLKEEKRSQWIQYSVLFGSKAYLIGKSSMSVWAVIVRAYASDAVVNPRA